MYSVIAEWTSWANADAHNLGRLSQNYPGRLRPYSRFCGVKLNVSTQHRRMSITSAFLKAFNNYNSLSAGLLQLCTWLVSIVEIEDHLGLSARCCNDC